MKKLDFYAHIEELIPFGEQISLLYGMHLKELQKLGAKSVIDIGCGSGVFAKLCMDAGISAVGVDLSAQMVARAKSIGINARCVDVCDIRDEQYDCATAIFDVLNYIPAVDIPRFFDCVANLLPVGGTFIADINTLHGFAEVADGDARFYDETRELFVSAQFDGERLESEFILFKKADDIYRKTGSKITQYYHTKKLFRSLSGWKLEKSIPIKLFSDTADKELLLFTKI